jgi:NADH-quinone oxidoreductase subunit M
MRSWLSFATFVLLLLAPLVAMAGPRVALTVGGRSGGPLVLAPHGDSWVGTFEIGSVGDAPLSVSRVSPRQDDDVRVPPRLEVAVEGGAPFALAPGEHRNVTVTWTPGPEARARQLVAHVVVTPSDEGAGEVAMGVAARMPTPLGPLTDHPLTLAILAPLVGALLLLGLRAAGRRSAERSVALGAGALHLGLVGWVFQSFRPDLGRFDGNEGLQLVDRAVWIRPLGVEWYVGADGRAIPFLLLVSFVLLAAILAHGTSLAGGRRDDTLPAVLASAAGATTVLVANDLVLLVLGVVLAVAPVAAGLASVPGGRAASRQVAVLGAGTLALLVGFVAVVHRASERAFLVDGTAVSRSFALPELARIDWLHRGELAGAPPAAVAFTLGLVAFAALAAALPFHPWLVATQSASPPSLGAWTVAIVPRVGVFGIVRVLVDVLPEGSRWGSVAMAGLGALTIAFGGLAALAERDVHRVAAYLGTALGGVALLGLSGLTPQGLAGATLAAFGAGLAAAACTLAAHAAEAHAGTRELDAMHLDPRAVPLVASMGAVAVLAAAALPPTAAFWGALTSVVGAFPRHPVWALVGAASLALLPVGAFGAALRATSGAKEGSGDAVPASERAALALLPIALLLVLLGVWPSPLMGTTATSVRDAVVRLAPVEPLRPGM